MSIISPNDDAVSVMLDVNSERRDGFILLLAMMKHTEKIGHFSCNFHIYVENMK